MGDAPRCAVLVLVLVRPDVIWIYTLGRRPIRSGRSRADFTDITITSGEELGKGFPTMNSKSF